MFDKYIYNNYFQIIVDGTGLQHKKKDYTRKCIKKVHMKTSVTDYYLSLNQKYKKHYLNVFKFVEKKNNKTTKFNFITNLDIDDSNIK